LQKSYAGRVKMIYIDPPYNTGNDFVYEDDYSEPLEAYLRRTGQVDEAGHRLTTNTKASGRFHSRWLSMMYPRLLLARQLLREDGVIFVSIDDNEVHNLRLLMNEVFGEENFVANIIWHKKRGKDNSAKFFSKVHEHVLVYSKDVNFVRINRLPLSSQTMRAYKNPDNDPRGVYRTLGLWSRGGQGGSSYAFTTKTGRSFSEREWLVGEPTMKKLDEEDRLIVVGENLYRKLFIFENEGAIPETIWLDTSNNANAADEIKSIFDSKDVFDTPKPTPLVKRMVELSCSNDDIILDFFSGSCTTAHTVLQQNLEDGGNRQFIMVQLPEPTPPDSPARQAGYATIAEIGKERIRRVIRKIQAEQKSQLPLPAAEGQSSSSPDLGFKVFKLRRSHFTPWQPLAPEQASRSEDLFAQSPLVEGWTKDGLLTEILLLEGFPLDSQLIPLEDAFTENEVRRVHHPDVGHDLFVCLDKEIQPATVNHLYAGNLLRREDIFICLDSALTDEAKVRLDDRLRLKVI